MKSPSIRLYSDYRKFLQDYVSFRQSRQPGWSYTSWAKKLGLSSSSTLIMIANGQRHPGKELIDRLIAYFQFSSEEGAHFRQLISIEKSVQNSELRVYLLDKMMTEEGRLPPIEEGNRSIDLIAQREAYVIQQMPQLANFSENAAWIKSHLYSEHNEKELEKLLAALEANAFLERDTDKRLRPKQANFSIDRRQVRTLHEQILASTRDAIENVSEDQRYFHSSFVSIKADKVDEAKRLLVEFQQKFVKLVEETPGDQIFQFNLHFFAATKPDAQALLQ